MCSVMSKELDGSCTSAATALALSPLATLGLRLALMILRRITFGHADRSLKVVIGSSKLTIRVSRARRSGSNRSPKRTSTDVPASGYTGITEPETGALPRDVSLSTDPPASDSFESLTRWEPVAS